MDVFVFLFLQLFKLTFSCRMKMLKISNQLWNGANKYMKFIAENKEHFNNKLKHS